MNRNLTYAGAFLLLLGVLFGFSPVVLLGFIILITAVITPSRPPLPRTPSAPPPSAQPRRIVPAGHPQQQAAATEMQSSSAPASIPPPQALAYTPALFPMPMFPSLSQMGSAPQPTLAKAEGKQDGQDELLEVGAMLALMKLVLG